MDYLGGEFTRLGLIQGRFLEVFLLQLLGSRHAAFLSRRATVNLLKSAIPDPFCGAIETAEILIDKLLFVQEVGPLLGLNEVFGHLFYGGFGVFDIRFEVYESTDI